MADNVNCEELRALLVSVMLGVFVPPAWLAVFRV